MLTIENIDSGEGFEALEPAWDELLEASGVSNIFLTYKWLFTWWGNFGSKDQLYILIIRFETKVVGLAPLMISSRTGKRVLQFIGSDSSDYADFIIGEKREAVIHEIIAYLDKQRQDWDTINLEHIPERSGSVKHVISGLSNTNLLHDLDSTEQCHSFVFEGDSEDSSNFVMKKGKALRNQINSLKKSGGLSLEVIEDMDTINRLMPTFFHYHIMRWHDSYTPSKFNRREMCDFYYDIVREFHSSNNLQFVVLFNGKVPIAFFFAFKLKRTLFLYTPSYSAYYSIKSPGIMLNNLLLETSIRQGFRVVNFLRGDEGYKTRFCNRSETNNHLVIYKKRFDYLKRKAVRGVKQTFIIRKLKDITPVRNAFTKLAVYRRNHSLWEFTRAVVGKCYRSVWDYRVLLIFRFDKRRDLSGVKAKVDVEIVSLGPDEIDVICSFMGCSLSSQKYQTIMTRFENGGECSVAIYNGTITCMVWAIRKLEYLREIDKYLKMKDNEVDLGDTFTMHAFRGLKIYQELLAKLIISFTNQGNDVIIATFSINKPSLAATYKVGFVHQRTIRTLRILGKKVF